MVTQITGSISTANVYIGVSVQNKYRELGLVVFLPVLDGWPILNYLIFALYIVAAFAGYRYPTVPNMTQKKIKSPLMIKEARSKNESLNDPRQTVQSRDVNVKTNMPLLGPCSPRPAALLEWASHD